MGDFGLIFWGIFIPEESLSPQTDIEYDYHK